MGLDMQKLSFRLSHLFAILASILLLCTHPLYFNSTSTVAAALSTDRLGLLAFKNSIAQDPNNVTSSWNDSIHFCHWIGVSCSHRHPERVTILNLQGAKLSGWLPPHIGNLSFLREINLVDNSFRGEIPQEIGRLSRLRYLNLSNNAFQGKIPGNLSSCPDLQVIDLNHNYLAGEIPFELSYLSTKQLNRFHVSFNDLSGSIPPWLGNASNLITLSMGINNFHGTVPIELGRLSKLQLLQIGANNLSGTIPPPIFNLSSLLYLSVIENQLYGRIPPDIGFTLPNLVGLSVADNRFTGSIPGSLSNASGLISLHFGGNVFTGTVPLSLGSLRALELLSISQNQLETAEPEGFSFLTSLTNCSNLQALDIGFNRFRGELPASISNLSTSLAYLTADANQISGTIPEGIEKLVGLTRLTVEKNSIMGEIPAGIGQLERLEELRLSENRISGAIPSSLGNITTLRRLHLNTNNLGGNIPPSLGNCQQLELLRLFSNNLIGVIPKEVVSLSSMILSFNLAQNSLTGPLPPEVGNMSKLLELDVSQNRLSGEIPSTISNCLMLELLLMHNNLFDGNIPSALNTLKSLHVLDLSRNSISGKIPLYLQTFTLVQNLNLSFNNLEGEVPHEGVFRNGSAFTITGNRELCGGIESLGLSACKMQVSNKRGSSLALEVAIPVAILCSTLLACFFLTLWRKKKIGRKSSTMLPMDEQFPRVSYIELSQATNQFSSSNLIGKGSYGSVYKGVLGTAERIVAVKVLNLKQKGAAKNFMDECNALRKIRHRNLIKVITTCSSIDSKGADFKALLFEFMPNGSLEELLHRSEDEQLNQGYISLSLRLNIAIDVAYAVEYLHHHCLTTIVHGDLKPSNVLLDRDMTAHVGDFGLARFLSESLPDDFSQNHTSSISIKGTVGYVAPEYGMGGKASKEGDVYGFGILLLEMFTGKRPTDSMFKDGVNIHRLAKMALPDRVTEIIEPSLLSEAEGDDSEGRKVERGNLGRAKFEECLAAILRIGVACSMDLPGERINMRDVVAELCNIKDKFYGIRNWDEGFDL